MESLSEYSSAKSHPLCPFLHRVFFFCVTWVKATITTSGMPWTMSSYIMQCYFWLCRKQQLMHGLGHVFADGVTLIFEGKKVWFTCFLTVYPVVAPILGYRCRSHTLLSTRICRLALLGCWSVTLICRFNPLATSPPLPLKRLYAVEPWLFCSNLRDEQSDCVFQTKCGTVLVLSFARSRRI